MRWALSDEQEELRTSLRGWLAHHAPADVVRKLLDAGTSAAFEASFLGEGWLEAGVPEEYGGAGGGLVELALTAEELGRSAAPSGAWTAAAACSALLRTTPAVADALAPHLASTTIAVRADRLPRGPARDARPALALRDGRLFGTVPLVLGATHADHAVVVAHGDDPTADPVLALVPLTAGGSTRTPRSLLDRSRSVADLAFDGTPAEPLDLDPADLPSALADVASYAAVLAAADSLGATERMVELAVAYSLQREQFGVPIGSFQAVKHAAATVLVGIEAARSITYYAAASVAQHHPEQHLHAAVAKAQATAAGATAADAALTMHGAIGFTWEHDLQLFYKRAKLDQALFGSPTTWNDLVADALTLVPTPTPTPTPR